MTIEALLQAELVDPTSALYQGTYSKLADASAPVRATIDVASQCSDGVCKLLLLRG